jgi:hypothetical protein
MAKPKKKPPRGDKYATKAADAQSDRQKLDQRWAKPQQELNKRNRGAKLINKALEEAPDPAVVKLLTEIFGNNEIPPIPKDECEHCGLPLKECIQYSSDGYCSDAPR